MRQWFATLRDNGIDTSTLSVKISRATSRKLNMNAGRSLLNARHAA